MSTPSGKKRSRDKEDHHALPDEGLANGASEAGADADIQDEQRETPEQREQRRAARRARKEAGRLARESATPAPQETTQEESILHGEETGEKRAKKEKKHKHAKADAAEGTGATNGHNGTAEKGDGSQSVSFEGEGSEKLSQIDSFAAAGFDGRLGCLTEGFTRPTPVQAAAWPALMSGRDVVGLAETGSGKTLAFLLPALHALLQSGSLKHQQQRTAVLVLAPTRELAMQTATVCAAAEESTGLRSVCCYGGVEKDHQRRALKRGVAVVVGTPGRLEDLANEGALDLSAVSCAVLDEADRMLDLGFEPAVRALLARTPASRRTAMFSATWPPAVEAVAAAFIRRPITVRVGRPRSGTDGPEANVRVTQRVDVCEPTDKDRRLLALLTQYHSSRRNRVLVFALYKKEAARLERMLQQRGWSCAAIHGDMSQIARTQALEAFRSGTGPLLVATDVAARGLDIPDVEAVINYTFPLTIEDYVHRIGRTGRAGRTGVAHTLFTKDEKGLAGELVNVLRAAKQHTPEALLAFGTSTKKKEHPLYGNHYRADAVDAKATHVKFD